METILLYLGIKNNHNMSHTQATEKAVHEFTAIDKLETHYVASKYGTTWMGKVSEMDINYSYPHDTEYFQTEEEANKRLTCMV